MDEDSLTSVTDSQVVPMPVKMDVPPDRPFYMMLFILRGPGARWWQWPWLLGWQCDIFLDLSDHLPKIPLLKTFLALTVLVNIIL